MARDYRTITRSALPVCGTNLEKVWRYPATVSSEKVHLLPNLVLNYIVKFGEVDDRGGKWIRNYFYKMF